MTDWRAPVFCLQVVVPGFILAVVVLDEVRWMTVVEHVLYVLDDLGPARHEQQAEQELEELAGD